MLRRALPLVAVAWFAFMAGRMSVSRPEMHVCRREGLVIEVRCPGEKPLALRPRDGMRYHILNGLLPVRGTTEPAVLDPAFAAH